MNDGTGLHRYWIGFDTSSEIPVGFRFGCGITAHSETQREPGTHTYFGRLSKSRRRGCDAV